MSSVKCECTPECQNRLWLEEDAYLWVEFRDSQDPQRETQVLRMDLPKLIELRDYLNKAIERRAGV